MKSISRLTEFDIGEEVFLKTDDEQLKRLVVAIIIYQGSILYRCACGTQESSHYDFEMSRQKNYNPMAST